MSSIFKPLIRKNKTITYLDDVFIQDTTPGEMLKTLTQNHKILKNENLKAAPDKSFFSLDSVKFLGHQIQNNHVPPLKSKIDGFLKLQPPKNKKEIKTMLESSPSFLNTYIIYKSFLDLFLANSETQDFKWPPELQQTFRVKKELTKGTLRLAIPNSEKLSISFVMLPITALEPHFYRKFSSEKWN